MAPDERVGDTELTPRPESGLTKAATTLSQRVLDEIEPATRALKIGWLEHSPEREERLREWFAAGLLGDDLDVHFVVDGDELEQRVLKERFDVVFACHDNYGRPYNDCQLIYLFQNPSLQHIRTVATTFDCFPEFEFTFFGPWSEPDDLCAFIEHLRDPAPDTTRNEWRPEWWWEEFESKPDGRHRLYRLLQSRG